MSKEIAGKQKNVGSSEPAWPSTLVLSHLASLLPCFLSSLLGSWRNHTPANNHTLPPQSCPSF